MCHWMQPLQVSDMIDFAKFDWKYHIFLNIKTEEWDLKIWLIIYWNDLALDSVETYFLEHGVYPSLKGATAGV